MKVVRIYVARKEVRCDGTLKGGEEGVRRRRRRKDRDGRRYE